VRIDDRGGSRKGYKTEMNRIVRRNGQSEPRIALSGMLNDESTLLAPSPNVDGHERSRMTRTSRLDMIRENAQMSAGSPSQKRLRLAHRPCHDRLW
jgi:hypothetical protein